MYMYVYMYMYMYRLGEEGAKVVAVSPELLVVLRPKI